MDNRILNAINRLDVMDIKNCISEGDSLDGITLDYVITQFGPADEDMLWGLETKDGDLEVLRNLDRRKAVIVNTLLDHGVPFDDECLVDCYTFRCPKTAKVLLAKGINPNRLTYGTESVLRFLRDGREMVGFNSASEVLLTVMDNNLLDYGAVEFSEESFNNIDKPPCMVIMMGLQGSGKSTFCEQNFINEGYENISLDIQKTRRREGQILQKCIDSQHSCVIDNTNPTKNDRARYIVPGKNSGFRVIGYFMQSKLADCLERNEKRDRQVPKKGILATYNKIEMPSLDEGFDELNFVSIKNGEFKISKWIEDEVR